MRPRRADKRGNCTCAPRAGTKYCQDCGGVGETHPILELREHIVVTAQGARAKADRYGAGNHTAAAERWERWLAALDELMKQADGPA